jgi:uncharacterized protein YecE (DUF72 family)
MTNLLIGAAGWDYKDWVGPFYPKGLKENEWLKYYAKYFDFTEINNTFYNLPTRESVEHWNNEVPGSFHFAVKLWQKITHSVTDTELETDITTFFRRMAPLESKIVIYLLQFPPWFSTKEKHLDHLRNIVKNLPKQGHYILELRETAWFENNVLKEFVDGKHISVGTSYLEGVPPTYPPQNRYYIRMIGNRELTSFGHTQRDQSESFNDLEFHVKELLQTPDITDIFVIFNNHYRGFSPSDINEFKKRLGLPFKDYRHQRDLFEFLKK